MNNDIKFDFGKCGCGNMMLTFSEYLHRSCTACHIKNTGLRKDEMVVEY